MKEPLDHYVPKFHLHQFARKGRVTVFDKESDSTYPMRVGSAAAVRGLDTVSFNGESSRVVDDLLTRLDGAVSGIVKDLGALRTKARLRFGWRELLATYMALERYRPPFQRDRLVEFARTTSSLVSPDAVSATAMRFMSGQWDFFCATDSGQFLLSDECCLYGDIRNRTTGQVQETAMLPISKDYLLRVTWPQESDYMTGWNAGPDDCNDFNKVVWRGAHRFVFAFDVGILKAVKATFTTSEDPCSSAGFSIREQ